MTGSRVFAYAVGAALLLLGVAFMREVVPPPDEPIGAAFNVGAAAVFAATGVWIIWDVARR